MDIINKIINGDCLDILPTIPDCTIQTCITSPPYWGLRDYGTATWEGGDPECNHQKATKVGKASTLRSDGREHTGPYDGEKAATFSVTPYLDICGKCGAHRIDSQLGLEKTPEEYVTKMVAVFREVRRVLKDDGVLFLNLGDSYAGGTAASGGTQRLGPNHNLNNQRNDVALKKIGSGLKPKDLVGIPWMMAFALRSDGWYLRSDIIWSKPNPMPESVTDRPTKAHEYLFLLSKSAKYFYDVDAIREEAQPPHGKGYKKDRAQGGNTNIEGCGIHPAGRNKRSVWTIPAQPFPEAHFAVMPEKLVEPCVLAGSAEGDIVLDPFCGAGTVPKVAKELQRQYIGIELNGEYIKIAEKRLAQKTLDLTK